MGTERGGERATLSVGRRVVVSGFGPFGEVCINASGLLAERLEGAVLAGLQVSGVVLPTAYAVARERIAAWAQEPAVVAVLALGVWRGLDVRIERRAGGVVKSERPDVHGEVWTGRVLGEARATRVPVEAWQVEGARVSEDCGGYVCNATYHALLEGRAEGLFVHVPRDVSTAGLASSEAVVRRVLGRLVEHVAGAR